MTQLNPVLAAALERVASGLPRRNLGAAAQTLSQHYRARGASSDVIGSRATAVAYAVSRMPATHAAVSSALAELARRAPSFSPSTLLDAGAGPGTASFAALARFPDIGAVTLVDHNPAFLALSAELAEGAPLALATATRIIGDIRRVDVPRADLVVAAYALTELSDADVLPVATRLFQRAQVLVVVEPGRSIDHSRLMAIKTALCAQGAETLAPCPHNAACPLTESDWCHFAARVNRNRTHRQVKGGTLGHEDEKFAYLVLARPGLGRPAEARVTKPAALDKTGIRLELCRSQGLEHLLALRRQADAFRQFRRLDWGDAVSAKDHEGP